MLPQPSMAESTRAPVFAKDSLPRNALIFWGIPRKHQVRQQAPMAMEQMGERLIVLRASFCRFVQTTALVAGTEDPL